jgi:hypothetical protein
MHEILGFASSIEKKEDKEIRKISFALKLFNHYCKYKFFNLAKED